MRALFFLNSFAGGGAERVCLNMAEELYKQGIESEFVTIFDSEPDYEIPGYMHIFPLKIKDKPLECLKIIEAVPKVNAFISGKKYELITAHVQPSQFLASLTLVGKKCFYVMHGRQSVGKPGSLLSKIGLRFFLRGKKVIAVSKGVEYELNNKYGIRPEDTMTIYNPCVINKAEPEKEFQFPNGRPYILFMGRWEEEKNPMLALDLYWKGCFYERYDLVYLGKGSLEKKLKNQIKEYNLCNHVFMIGFQKNPMQWIRNASLLLSCSKQEGLPMNLIEALTCGTPVVATDCPYGPNEILTDELSKYLIHPEEEEEKSIAAIASALECYPEIVERYYDKFQVSLVVQNYLNAWKRCFC